jgi:hypothetical protein
LEVKAPSKFESLHLRWKISFLNYRHSIREAQGILSQYIAVDQEVLDNPMFEEDDEEILLRAPLVGIAF